MVFAIVIAVVLVLLCAVVYMISNKLADIVVHPHVHPYEESRQQVLDHNCPIDPYSVLENHRIEEFKYKSEFGYELYGRIIYADDSVHFADGKQRVIILSHGWTSNHITMLTYGKIYQELGFTVVGFDHRYHGKSDKNIHCTMGLYESKDLVGLANFIKKKFPEGTLFGIQGESMGSATAMMASPDIPWLSFLVEDCGYATMRGQMNASARNSHVTPFPFVNVGGWIMKHKYGLDMDKVVPKDAVARLNIPMLFCQGDNDTFVPTKMIYEVYEAKKDKKKMQLFAGSKHAESIWDHTNQYRQVVKDFLTEYKFI